MKRKIGTFFMLFNLLFSHVLIAQNQPQFSTLKELWREADQNNMQLKIVKTNLDKSRVRTDILKEERLPEIGVDLEYSQISNMPVFTNGLFNSPQYNAVVHHSYSAELNADFNLYNGGKLKNSIQQNKLNENIAHEKILREATDVHYQIIAYYLDIYRNVEYENFLKKDIKERETHLKDIKNLFEKGVILKSDVLRAELSLSQQNEILKVTENNIAISTNAINRITGAAENRKIMPELDFKVYIDENNSVEQVHDYKILQDETSKSQLELQKVKSNVYPKINLFAHYGYSYPQILFYPYEIAWYGLGMAGVKVTFPISNLYTNKKKRQQAEIEISSNQLKTEDFQQKYYEELSRLQIRYKESLEKIEIAEKNIDLANETYRIMKNSYFAQLVLLTDFLTAENELLQANFDYATAKTNAELLKYQLLKLSGKL
ncbi:TolC family protein [Cloacibacterium sp.]|uniref:TolC family protein n=1 Tax=Cloacibacterium sp. TaxID=1913682 RepID=UPI0039E449DE